jgi:hypothetical protein
MDLQTNICRLMQSHQVRCGLYAHRDTVVRVWEWLDVNVSRDASLSLGAFDLGHLRVTESSPATTAATAAFDAAPCDAVEPCVSSLQDGQVMVHIL